MSSDPTKFELNALVAKLIDGSISQSEFDELKLRLGNDENALNEYVSELEIESLLFEHFGSTKQSDSRATSTKTLSVPVGQTTSNVPSETVAGTHREPSRLVSRLLALAAAVLLAASIGYFSIVNESPSDISVADVTQFKAEPLNFVRTVARVTNGNKFQCVGEDNLSIGSWLVPGKFNLTQGDIEVTFDTGTTVVMSSPSTFEIVGVEEMRLIKGALEADVPDHAIGFRVHTPSGEIVDLSTKFAVSVDDNGGSNINVIEGLVEALPNQAGTIPVVQNSSLRMNPDAPPEEIDFEKRSTPEFASLKNDEELQYFHFSFDAMEGSLVKNQSPIGSTFDSQIESTIENDWFQVAGKHGKSIFMSGRATRIDTPFESFEGNRPRTIAYWTRVMPRTDPRNSTAMIGWSGADTQFGSKWQIGWNPARQREGNLGAIRTDIGNGYVIGSTDLRDRAWHHVVSVFLGGEEGDDVSELIRHYVDGKLEPVSEFKSFELTSETTTCESMTIGDKQHGYKGWIDEVYVFDAVLTPAQIIQLMNENKPPLASEIVPN